MLPMVRDEKKEVRMSSGIEREDEMLVYPNIPKKLHSNAKNSTTFVTAILRIL